MTIATGIPLEPLRPPPRASEPASRWRLVARRTALVAARLLAGYYVVCLLLLVVYRFADPPITGVQLERRLEALVARRRYVPEHRPVPLARIAAHVPRALVVAEDGRFYQHWGYDLRAMWHAGRDALGGEGVRGASTITQQLVKNLFGCTCRNPVRKFYDLTLALPAHLILGRQRILELYLNHVEWGPGIFGVEAAARRHYGRSARALSRAQAAGLAALLPNPLRRTRRTTAEYRAEILRRMEHRGW